MRVIVSFRTVENMSVWSIESEEWVNHLGKKLFALMTEPRSGHLFVQKIGLAIHRGNASRVLGSLTNGTYLEEVLMVNCN